MHYIENNLTHLGKYIKKKDRNYNDKQWTAIYKFYSVHPSFRILIIGV